MEFSEDMVVGKQFYYAILSPKVALFATLAVAELWAETQVVLANDSATLFGDGFSVPPFRLVF